MRTGSVIRWTLSTVVIAVSLVLLAPAVVGVSTLVGPAQLVALRGVTAIGLLVGAGFVLLLAVVVRLFRGRIAWLVVPALVLVLSAVAQVGVGTVRSFTPGAVQARSDLVVAGLNTEHGLVGDDEFVRFVRSEGLQVVAMPETDATRAAALQRALARAGLDFQRFGVQTGDTASTATSLLVDRRLGAYRQARAAATTLGSVAAVPVDGDGPRFVAVHTNPPIPTSADMRRWRHDVPAGLSGCHGDAVVAGDFNATVDHAVFAVPDGCRDAAASTTSTATWPTSAPTWMGGAIDHVLATTQWRPVSTEVRVVGGSDHRAIIAHLHRVG
ncbi:endonuclease/exonuclease/phosphatase family protein [Curtobacterium sp. VKM Ac-2922]|uniref:endonuclease/exonuclease/phosphatase family protein n=1 Tax=Curtobacterium sp. VKM Ac-2922 TaxID=2929475 RepID=UPI001FB20A88|nr:endonuclease/exonuclease/phosphatase family protein [Curtobacterium sp. VKM Ac-2922]MCJ1715796.1 endonuclease/exonuclease/phosphatase family protein [Curtobacterium sp. VKM Ac-2922]